jgi:hypothetical protein
MKRFEYNWLTSDGLETYGEFHKKLDILGGLGWEAYGLSHYNTGTLVSVFLKREIKTLESLPTAEQEAGS